MKMAFRRAFVSIAALASVTCSVAELSLQSKLRQPGGSGASTSPQWLIARNAHRLLATTTFSPSLTPSSSPSVATAFPTTSVLPTSTSLSMSHVDNGPGEEETDAGQRHSWSMLFPVLAVAVMAWAARANSVREKAAACWSDTTVRENAAAVREKATACWDKTNVREKATACVRGDICFAEDGSVPGEIVVKSGNCSVAGDKPEDVELMPVATFENATVIDDSVVDDDTDTRVGAMSALRLVRNSTWNTLPEDPVDVVSLKGSSFYCSSSDEDDNIEEPRTSYVRM